jgi:hypothetical protein
MKAPMSLTCKRGAAFALVYVEKQHELEKFDGELWGRGALRL